MDKTYSLQELKSLPTLGDSGFDDLKIETDTTRVWLSRCDVNDFEPFNNKVTVENYINNDWEITRIYQAQ
jgi:hypothetical protein